MSSPDVRRAHRRRRQPSRACRSACIAEEGEPRDRILRAVAGADHFFSKAASGRTTKEAVRVQALNLRVVDAPAGTMDVVLGNGWTGILPTRPSGIRLKGDFNRKGSSLSPALAAEGRLLCTIVDDGTIADRRGSLNVDDEGTPTRGPS